MTENENLARSIGTRHRASSACRGDGRHRRRGLRGDGAHHDLPGRTDGAQVVRDELADELRVRLGGDESKSRRAGPWVRVARALFGNPGRKAFALLLGFGLFLVAFRSVRTTQEFSVEVRVEQGEDANVQPVPGVLTILLPSDDAYLQRPARGRALAVSASAAQATLGGLAGGIGGVLVVDESWIGSTRIDVDAIRWGQAASRPAPRSASRQRNPPLPTPCYRTARGPLDPDLFRERAEDGTERREGQGRWRTRGRPGDPRVRARHRPGPRAGGRDRGAPDGGRQLSFEPVSVADSGSASSRALLDPDLRRRGADRGRLPPRPPPRARGQPGPAGARRRRRLLDGRPSSPTASSLPQSSRSVSAAA